MLTQEQKIEFMRLAEERERRTRTRRLYDYFPDTGPLRRELYPKHLAFFEAGAHFRERAMVAANRVGKSEGAGGYEMALHLTGRYPEWWKGRRFEKAISAWAGGDTTESTRDIIQAKLLGTPGSDKDFGTGLIPGDDIVSTTRRAHVANAVETIVVRHVSGGFSTLTLKSYEQGRKKWQGTEKHVVWFDEEPPLDIYEEGLTRTMTIKGEPRGGIVMATFTPLQGLSNVVLSFMPGGKIPGVNEMQKFVVFADWDDVPHLSAQAKAELLASYHPHQRAARSRGVPSLGSGAIYPVDEDFIKVPDFLIPPHWRRAYALDVGWRCTAAVWGAIDPETDITYIYAVYKRGMAEPPIHASAIKAKGAWIPGVIDPASRGGSQRDGEKLLKLYRDEELDLITADNAVEVGIHDTWTALSTGQLKVFRSLSPWFDEFRIYRRNEAGKIVKENDHLMDTTRYLWRSGRKVAITKPIPISPNMIIGDVHGAGPMAS
jgi:phage terminase large subunit-like protein